MPSTLLNPKAMNGSWSNLYSFCKIIFLWHSCIRMYLFCSLVIQVYNSKSLSLYSSSSLPSMIAKAIFFGKVFILIASLIIIFKTEPCGSLLIT